MKQLRRTPIRREKAQEHIAIAIFIDHIFIPIAATIAEVA
jgi:hypothetical protein